MTSTNDGSNLKSGKKDKRYYIESFQSLEARLNGQASTEQRTRNVCEAWRLVHGLCSHSTPDTRSHLLSWIQRNTAYAILQDEWGLPENKPHHVELEKAINDFILECHETDTLLVWETTLLRRAVWYKGVLSNPWGHSVLKALLDPKSTQPTDQEVIEWLREERAMMFVTRVRVMARAKRLFDLALVLVSAVMTRARAPAHSDQAAPGVQGGSKSPNFVETLSREAGFTKDVWELLMDIEFVLLHKQDQSTCIDLAKKIPLKDGKRIVERLRFRLDKSPADKKLWKKAKDVAILIAQVVITRCMVVTSCAGAVLDALSGCASALTLLLDGSRLPQAAAALAAPAATAAHLYAFANAIAHQCKDKVDRQPFVCELYVRAITAGMNELEGLKLEKDKEPEVCALQHTISGWFTRLGEVLSSSARLRCECLLTAFSLHPSATMYERVAALPPIAAPEKSPKRESTEVTSEFGSWATDSRTSSNFVKTSETLNLKQTQKQTNILSSSMFDTECGALGLKTELCEDLAVLLSGPRVKTLSWDMDRDTLLENCRVYMERTQEGTRALTTELRYLNLDPKTYDHLPEEEDDEDNYYGIEKGYEVELEYEDIWSDNNIEYAEGCESACSISTVDSTKNSTKPKGRKNPAKFSEDESDPLSLDADPNYVQSTTENKKKTVKKQNDVTKKKSKPKNVNDPESKKLSESDQEKELLKKQKRKERRDRKKREKMEMLLKQELLIGRDDNTSNPTGTNIVSAGVEPVKERRKQKTTGRTQHVSATDSDYDSQGKSSMASINSEGNDNTDVLFGGLFSMGDVGSLEKTTSNNVNSTHDTNSHRSIIMKQTDTQDYVKDKLKNLLQFRQQSNQVEKAHSASKINIVWREGVQSQIQDASPRSIICKTAEPENLGNNLKRSEKNIGMDASKRNVPANNAPKKTHVAPSRKKNQARAQAAKPGLLISDPHQLQFQEFLKRHNIPITNNANKQHPPTTSKEPQSQLAQRNPVLTGLIQQMPELHQHVNSVKDINKAPSNCLVNSEVQKLQQQNLSMFENKKNLPQKCGVDNAPNTFSRLSYMHKNKQADIKYKQLNEQMKTPISKIIDNDSLVKIKNLQAKGEICISKALKRNTIAISRENPPPLIKQGERIPNPLTTAAVQPKDLRLNIVNVSKATKEIFENKVIIKKQQKATTPVDLQCLIHERNLDVGSNWKSQYPNTVIEKSTDKAPINVGNISNEVKVVVLGVESDEPINKIAHENKTKVVVSHSAQYNNKDDIKVTPNIGAQLENSEDWKYVMNKLISLKSEKKGVDALEMALNRNSSIKGNAEIFRHLPKNTANSKSINYQEHNKMSSNQKGRTSVVDTKPNLIKNAIVIKTDQPNIKKVVKKSIPKHIDPTKSLTNTNTLKTNNVIMPSMPNSDYDQLDDLIDDELRQEIEESSPLTSEVDIVYGPARVRTATSDKEKLAENKSSQEIKSVHSSFANYNMEQSTRQSSIESVSNPATRTCSVIKENSHGPSVKPKLHIISDQILPPYTKSSGSKTEKYSTESNESRSSVVAMRPLSNSQKVSCGVPNNNISVITSPINIVHPANVILRNVSNTNHVQNLMLITPTNIIPASTLRAPIVEQPKVLNVTNQTAYVLNTSLFSSPETVQVGSPSMDSVRTDLPKPNHQQCRSDLLKSNGSKKHEHANAITEVIRQSNLESHANIGTNRLKGEELIKSHSINQTVAQHSDERLKINLKEGHALLISTNRIKDSNISNMNLPFFENQFQHPDETSNIKNHSNTEKKSYLKSELHQNLADLPNIVSDQIMYKESKCEDISSNCVKRVEIQSNVIEFNTKIYNKQKVRSPSILSENYDQIMDTEFSTDMKDEVAKTGTLEYKNTKEASPSILNDSFDRIVNTELTTDTKGELAKTEIDENKKIAKIKSPSILSNSCNQIKNTEFTTDMADEIYKTETNNSEKEKGKSLFLLSDSCKQIMDQNFITTVKNKSDIPKKDDENSTDLRQSYNENDLKDCFEKSLDIDISSKHDKQTKLKKVICDPKVVNILNEATESDLNVVTNKTLEIENYLVTEMPKSYGPDLPQDIHEPIMTLAVYIPQKKTVDLSTIDNMSTKFCKRKDLSRVQEYELSKASEIVENKKSLNNKHPQDHKSRSDIERLRRKRLSIIHREINHYIPSEPIALMYAPIQIEKRTNNDEITQPKTSSQNNLIDKKEERLKLDNESNAKVSVTNSEVVQLNSECCIKKSDNIPTRRLRSSHLFRTKECTTLDDSNNSLPDSELQTNSNNVSEAKKTASKRISESSLSSDSFVTREKNNELLDNTHNIDANKKLKENTDRLEHVTANSKSVNCAADTIDLTDTEPIKELNLKNVSVCGLLNSGPVTTSIPKIRQQVHKPSKDIRKTSLRKEVTVTDIKELPSPTGDVMKKILRIKLSNGNVFRATVSGNLKVDIKTILSEPSIKSILSTNILNSRSCTVNVKHFIDSNNVPNKNILISRVVKKSNHNSTEIIELSDDEDENIYYFKTEFGTYKTKSVDSKAYEKHQNKFLDKCTVKLPKIDKNMTLYGLTAQNIVLQNEDVSISKISDVTNSCENSNYKIIDSSEKTNITEKNEINSETPSLKTENILANLKDLQSTLLKSQIVQLHNDCCVNLARCDQEMKLRDCGFNSANPFDEPKGSGDTLLSEENVPDKTSNSFSLSSDTQIKDEKYGDILRSFDLIPCNSDWISGTKPTIHSFELLQQKYLKSMYDVQTECYNLKKSSSSDTLSNLSDTDCNDKSALRPDSPSIIADFESKARHNSYTFVQSFCNSDWMLYTKATIHSLEVRHQQYIKAEPILQVNSDINLDSSTDCDSDLELDGVRQEIEELKISFQVPSLFNLVYTLITSNVDVLERYLTQKDKNCHIFNSPTHTLKRKLNTSDTRNNSKIFKNDSNVFEKQVSRKSKHTSIILDHPTFVDEAATQHYVLEATARNGNVKDISADHAESVDKVSSFPKILWHGDSSNNDNNDTCEKNNSISEVRVTKENRQMHNNTILEETQTYPIKSNCNKIQLILNDQEKKNSMKNLEKKVTPIQEFEKIIILDNKINVSNDRFNEAHSNNIMSVFKAPCATELSKDDSSYKCEENESNLEALVNKKENVTIIQTSINSQTLKIKNNSNTKFECNDQESNSAIKYIESNKSSKDCITNSVNMFESNSNVADNADENEDINKDININNAVDDQIRAAEVDFEIEKNESNEHTDPKVFEIPNQGMSNSMLLMDSKKDDEIKLQYNQDILQEVVTNANVNNAVHRICATEVDFEIKKNESKEHTYPKVFEILNQEKLVQGSENNEKNVDNGSTNDTIINETSENEDASVGNNTIKLEDEENLFCATEDTLNYKKQKISEKSLVTTDVELSSKKLPKSSKCENVTTFETTLACPTKGNTTKIDTNIGQIDLSKAPEDDNILNEDQSQLKSLEINNFEVNIIEDVQECKTSIQDLSPNKSNEVVNGNVRLNSTELSVTPSFSLECEQNNQENQLQTINKDESTSSISENVVEKNKRQKNENDSVTLIYKGNSNVVLKGSPYVDPVVGTCYIFPLSSSSCNRRELTSLNANQTVNMIKALKKKSINEIDDTIDQSNFSLIIPKMTYSRPNNANIRQLKRKSDTKNDCKLQKKYRKGKNIDTCKQTSQIYAKIAYTSEYKRLLEYYTTIKFSYSRPFHKNSIDPGRLLQNWPIQDRNCDNDSTVPPLEECEKLIFHDINKENKAYFDPLQQTLAEEIAMEYNNEKECPQFDQTEDSNFNMGFGEGSDRVIQNLANGIFYTSKFSAATLSDVKLPQPYFTTRDKIQNVPQIIKKTNDEELAIMKRCISFIQLRDKVKDFFKRSACELHCNWNVANRSSKKFLYELTSPQFLDPPTHEMVVNVVQVGQLPVSASAQNPVTCDPRVTHVSNASPPQCSAENSPDSDQNTSKTEYTELTTADLSLPLVQEYQHSSQVIMSSQSQLSVPEASKVSIDANCENKVEAENDNTEESNNFLPDHKSVSNISYAYNPENDSFKSGNNSYRSVNESYKSDNDSYKSDSYHKPEFFLCKPDNNALLSENSRTLDAESQNAIFDSLLKEDNNDYVSTPKTTNGTSEKTDQIAHAMNAAGITTGSDSINNNSRAHALVNILSQKIRQNTGNATQTSVNSYTKGSPINAMALQQALAQILPPPLNQTNSSDNQSTSLTPQVLHIVQGKNTSGNQITIVDNQPNSVINNSNNTPVLHIVQNKSSIGGSSSNSNSATQNNNSFSGLSLVDAGIQQGGNQLLHIVNTGGQKNNTSGQLLKRVNLLTNLTNVQGNNEQKMVQFVCKSADGKSIQLNAPHQRSMVLRLQPIEPTNVSNAAKPEGQDNINQSPNFVPSKENNNTQQEIKSRSVYEENYAKFIQNSSPKSTMPEKSTSLPKFNQAFGKQVFQDNNQKSNEMQSNSSSHVASTNSSTENVECSSNDNAINLEHINQINSPPLLLRKSPPQTSQSQQGQSNLVQQIKQTIAPVNIQTMHGGVIYTRQIPVNIGGGQTINLITVPSTELMDESGQKHQGEVKFVNQNEIEQSIIKIVPQSQNSSTSESASEDNNALNASNDAPHTSSATHTQPVLTQMRIKLPMLSKTPQMVSGARLVRPSFFQIQRNVIGGANQPVYQQLVLTAAPSLGQQSVRPPQAQPVRVKTTTENQTSSESQMSSSTLEQLREFDMVLEQVKERSTVQPNSNTNSSYTKMQSPTETTESNTPASVVTTEPTQQVLYSIGNNNSLNVAYVNRKPAATTPTTSTFARSPDSSGVADSPTSSTHVQIPAQSSSNETSSDTSPQQSHPKPKSSSKSKSRPKTSTNPTTSMKINTVPPKTSTQKPLEDEQTTQRILYILAEYKEQVENSPDKDKPAPRRRSNPPSNPGSSKRKKSSSGSRRPGGRDMSPIHGEDTCRTMGSEDSSCGTSQGDCTENCLESHSPQDSPRKVVRKLTFENETSNATSRQQPARNVIVADGQTITVARGTAGKPATAVLMPANYILPVSMVKGGQQIAIVTNRGPKILTVGGEGGGNALLLQRLIGPAGLKPVLARPGVRHVRLPTAALHNLQAFNIATATSVQPPDSTASPAPAPTPPDLVETRATGSPWPDRDPQDVKPERSSSPEGSEPWNLPSSADPHDYSYEETVRAENLDRTVLDAIPDRYSPDLEAQRIFDKMFDVDTKKSYIDSQDDSPRCGYDIETSDCDDKGYQQVVQKRDQRQHRLAHVSAAALRHKYAILEHELRLQKSLSEECEDLGVDSPSAAELFPEAELLFASSPAHESSHHGHTPQPGISQTIPQPDIDDQIATDQLLNRSLQDEQLDVTLGLDEGIVTVSEDGMQATITLDQEEFARSHPNTTFHSEPTEEENVQPYTISGIKGRHITSTIFHAGRAPATVLMTAPQTTVISQAADTNIKYIDNVINPMHNVCLSSVLVKDDGLTKYDNILNDSRELHLSNTASAIVHSNATQVIRRVCYDEDKNSRFLLDESDALIAGDDAKMIAEDSSRDATLESIADDRSSPERHTELFWESNSASERSDSRRPLDFSSDSDKCCKSPLYDETNSTDSSGVGTHMRLDSVIKDARGLDRSGSADNSSADDTIPPLRTYPPKRMYHVDGEMERSVSGKTRAGERSPDGHEVRRRASVRGVVKRGCHCCNGSPAPPRPKKSRQKKPSIDFNN
ncbi:uncharacterized protein LOC121736603 isoform X2 [Aricia agestis]|uniref:uncharacterized protein LOC121736603 isoform X2 n=1 Tax=Aricia agestis TaxID=91739 RepID=UPI001C20A93B|nr:uncharacterized protein LOC121736603 isoform X2 [Aricia agestis]